MTPTQFELQLKMELNYNRALMEYNHNIEMLAVKRKKFYEDNPDFWCKTMYMNVCAPPCKIEIKIID